ncbi:ABC transporter substrate-binding protein [Candidatus Riflebacteria bacterium]
MKRVLFPVLLCFFLLLVFLPGCFKPASKEIVFYTAGTWKNPPAFHGNPWIDSGRGSHENFVWEPLYIYVPQTNKFIPRLAQGQPLEAKDRKSIKITIRKGVFWHDGKPFTSKDVKTTFMVWYLQNWGENLAGIETDPDKLPKREGYKDKEIKGARPPTIETPDEHTIIFNWFRPCNTVDKIQLLTEPIKLSHHIFGKWADAAEQFIEKAQKLNELAVKRLQKKNEIVKVELLEKKDYSDFLKNFSYIENVSFSHSFYKIQLKQGYIPQLAKDLIEKELQLNALIPEKKSLEQSRFKERSPEELEILQEIMEGKAKVRKDLYNKRPPIPIGTGPFKVTRVTASDIILDKFDQGWNVKKISIDKVRILKWPGNETIWAYLIAGKVDAVGPATPPDVTEQIMKINPKTKLITPDEQGEFGFIFNLNRKPMSDLSFRKAVAFLIDRDLIRKISYYYSKTIKDFHHGVVDSLTERWLDEDFADESLTKYEYNPDHAVRILENHGYRKGENGFYKNPDGSQIKLEIAAQAGASDWVLGAESLASQLVEFGVDAKVRLFEANIYGSQILSSNFDIAAQFGTDYKRFAHPGPSYRRYFGKTGFIRKASGFPSTALSYDGSTINFEKHIMAMYKENDFKKVKELVKELAWVANEELPFLTIYEKRLMIFLQEGKHVKGWPAAKDPIWSTASQGLEKLYCYLIAEGIVKDAGAIDVKGAKTK